MNNICDYLYKFILIGDSSVGKSNLLLKYTDDTFTENTLQTIGMDFKIHTIIHDSSTIKLQIWDTAGQERFRTITTSYYRGAHAVLMVFDLTNYESFKNIRDWLKELDRYNDSTEIILVGNKCDKIDDIKVSDSEIKTFCEEFGIEYISTSAKDGTNVDDVFYNLTRRVYDIKKPITHSHKYNVSVAKKSKKKRSKRLKKCFI